MEPPRLNRMEKIFNKYRMLLAVFILPFNVLYRIHQTFCSTWLPFFKPKPSLHTHQRKVERVQGQVRKWSLGGRTKKMCTARPKTHSVMFRQPKYRDTLHSIRVDDLNDILSIDFERKIVKVEPLVTMGQLTAALVPLGWSIPVVPEFEALTVGGLVMGGGIETSSHKFGLFHNTCKSYEIVVANGDVIACSMEENSDLFQGIPFSYGTLGFLTAAEIQIIPVPRFVKLEYHPVTSMKDGISLLQHHAENEAGKNDFVEAIAFTKEKWVIILGKLVASPTENVNHMGRWYKPWFYKHVESFLKKGFGQEYVPLRDYYHRHTRSTFWLAQISFAYGNWPPFRYILGWMLPVSIPFMKSIIPEKAFASLMTTQDFMIPGQAIPDFMEESERQTMIYPIWFCPFKLQKNEVLWHKHKETKECTIFFDIGIYGVPTVANFDIESATRKMEKLVLKHKGAQALYTDTFASEEEFCQMFNMRLYELMRKKYDAEDAFPHIWTKVSRRARIEGL